MLFPILLKYFGHTFLAECLGSVPEEIGVNKTVLVLTAALLAFKTSIILGEDGRKSGVFINRLHESQQAAR